LRYSQIAEKNLQLLTSGTYNVSSFYPSINTTFGIDWTVVAYVDLNKPLYSGLAARLLLAHAETNDGVVIGNTLAQQV